MNIKPIYINSEKTMYRIDEMGNVYSDYTGKGKIKNHILKPNITENGYAVVCLYHNGKKYWRYVHRLVAIVFIEIPDELKQYSIDELEVNHIDGSLKGKSKNTIQNLEWTTSSGNKYHAYKHGLKKRGEECSVSIYTNDQIRKVCEMLQSNNYSNRVIWKKTNASVNTIQAILNGKQWKHISKDYDFTNHRKRHCLYTKEEIILTLDMLANSDLSFKDIGDIVGMTRNSVWFLNKKYSIRNK